MKLVSQPSPTLIKIGEGVKLFPVREKFVLIETMRG
jgi:hypothetical protein